MEIQVPNTASSPVSQFFMSIKRSFNLIQHINTAEAEPAVMHLNHIQKVLSSNLGCSLTNLLWFYMRPVLYLPPFLMQSSSSSSFYGSSARFLAMVCPVLSLQSLLHLAAVHKFLYRAIWQHNSKLCLPIYC